LNAAFNAVLRNPQVRDGIKALGLVPKAMTPEQFGAFMRGDMRKWPPIITAAGLSAE
jgi:tripartite-type tricarboxylate transporter receptor subunit TctC